VSGVANFTDLKITGPGTYTLTFRSTGLGSATSGNIAVIAPTPGANVVTKMAGDGQSAIITHAVTTPPRVLVTNASGVSLPNVVVTFAVASGGGSITGASAVTGSDGTAAVGSWTLGSTVGANTLTATVSGVPPVTFTATATPPMVTVTPGVNGTITGDRVLYTVHANVVGDPHAIATVTGQLSGTGVTVTFTPTSNPAFYGCANGTPCWVGVVDLTGLAPSTYQLVIDATDAVGTHGTATLGIPKPFLPAATVTTSLTNGTLAVGGTTTGTAIVRDANGVDITNYNAGNGHVVVTWTSSTPSVATVTPNGAVTAVAPGTTTLTATAEGKSSSVNLTVVAASSAPTTVTKSAGDGQSAIITHAVPTPPRVLVTDANGVSLPNVPVTFAVASGGGSITGASAVTGSDGTAAVGSWTLGSAVGPNTLTATVSGVPPVTFTATATGPVVTVTPGVNGTITGNRVLYTVHAIVVGDPHPIATITGQLSGTGVTVTFTPTSNNAFYGCSAGPCWIGVVDLTGLPPTSGLYQLVIDATDAVGTHGTAALGIPKSFLPAATVTTSLTNGTLAVGGTTSATAIVRDANGVDITNYNAGNGHVVVTWTSSAPNVATVSASGLVTAVAPGTATITATAEGVSGSANVTVVAP
jgi:adhesin/invasin